MGNQQQKMPKVLLQSSLRSILVNLAHTRLLVTFGVKLLDHLKKWLEPEMLSQTQKSSKAGDESKVATAMFDLFHLLPPAAGKFLDDIVRIVIDLEGILPQGQFYSESNSTYRIPLAKFLNLCIRCRRLLSRMIRSSKIS